MLSGVRGIGVHRTPPEHIGARTEGPWRVHRRESFLAGWIVAMVQGCCNAAAAGPTRRPHGAAVIGSSSSPAARGHVDCRATLT